MVRRKEGRPFESPGRLIADDGCELVGRGRRGRGRKKERDRGKEEEKEKREREKEGERETQRGGGRKGGRDTDLLADVECRLHK